MGYLHICHWDRFQHYKKRNPPWIRLYTDLLSRDDYLNLTGHRRAILHGLWIEYARSSRRLPDDTVTLSRRLELRVLRTDLDALNHAGFIEFSASAVLAECKQSAIPEAETETREINPLLREVPKTSGKRPRNILWDALVAAIYGDGFVPTSTERGRLNKAIKELNEVNATPQQVGERVAEYRRRYQDAALTPQALTGNWSSLNGAKGRSAAEEADLQRSRDLAARMAQA